MGLHDGSASLRKGKHLNRNERIQLEGLWKVGYPPSQIAVLLGRHVRTIERELERGRVEHLNSDLTRLSVYNADRAQDVHDLNASAKGPPVKLKAHSAAEEIIRLHIVDKRQAPEVVAALMKRMQIEVTVCAKTIYTYINNGWIPGVSNESLWEKRQRGKKHKSLFRKAKRISAPGHGISDRPAEVETREEAGHWEIDLVVSGTGQGPVALLTLVERKSRKMIVRKIADKTQRAVQRALNGIERSMGPEAFRAVFKTITADNGGEFLDVEALECSVFGRSRRTSVYYAHPYSSWERGTNENGNRMIRRFVPKGSDISKFTRNQIADFEKWINNYPRKILGFRTAEEMFIQQVAA
jgi:IS30 family transposase